MCDVKKYFKTLSDNELLEMANVNWETTGIENVVIWIGPNPKSKNKIVKVGNIPNRISSQDCFTITIPKFEIIGEVNDSFIDSTKISQIKEFISKNMKLIEDYSDYKISTKYLLDNLKSI